MLPDKVQEARVTNPYARPPSSAKASPDSQNLRLEARQS
jgi:hypothetical protein